MAHKEPVCSCLCLIYIAFLMNIDYFPKFSGLILYIISDLLIYFGIILNNSHL